MRVCAVVVTYNRLALLRRCVESLLGQTYPVSEVIIVDNNSQFDVHDELGVASDRLTFYRFQENTGGAGGFHFGMTEAFRRGHDAVWLMDDDGCPSADCLAYLVAAATRHGVDFGNPLVINEMDAAALSFSVRSDRRDITRTADAESAADGDGLIAGSVNPFNGTLLTRRAFAAIGAVKFECFIWGDEAEYHQRALAAGLRVATIVAARHFHPPSKSNVVKVWVGRSAWLKIAGPERGHYFYRNIGYIGATYLGLLRSCHTMLAYLVYFLMRGEVGQAWRFIIYYMDGAFDSYRLEPSRAVLADRMKKLKTY